jgi:hypothetical protein
MKTWITKDGVSDADLMRAARDMLDALEFAEFAMECPSLVSDGVVERVIRAALAKVRGEA